ncbi:MAG: indolepyruvate ferredoxin oxidoreductase subunit alpha [Anaerolineae bacterium]|nr:indolepyruvate ferredoxin oxidoreductase subunit alpha [Anaerolineae bacterium]
MKRLLLGNEALALGARAAGVAVATGYPGTPSTEIMEHFARYPGVRAQWCVNEKVALEVAIGASLGGARTMVTMKHVGLNVAADPFFAAAYTGVNAGLVVLCADDPGMHSSQGEQDNRNYARFAKVPLLEPSDSQECFDMVGVALDISEEFDIPVLLRTTGRVSHAQSVVEVDPALFQPTPKDSVRPRTFIRAPAKYVMLPGNARTRRLQLEERLKRLRQYAETTSLNQTLWQDRRLGVVSGSIAYQYAREAFPTASFLKLGMAYPFPADLVSRFAREVEVLVVVEELDPFLEEQIRSLPALQGMPIHGRDVFPGVGELSTELVAGCAIEHGLLSPTAAPSTTASSQPVTPLPMPPRPPVLCAGCPHRATFYVLGRLHAPAAPAEAGDRGGERQRERVIVTGDIGCYTLGALPPLSAMDTCLCMGASIGTALGMEMAGHKHRVVAVIGDGTFYHSGITGLVEVVTSGAATTIVIMDNGTTAMTGGNPNPGSGITIQGAPAPKVTLESLCRGLGVQDVVVVDAYDTEAIRAQLERSLRTDDPTVVIVRAPCRLQVSGPSEQVAWVDPDECVGCEVCLRAGCPALTRAGDKVEILAALCTACNLCGQICPHDAIHLGPRERTEG